MPASYFQPLPIGSDSSISFGGQKDEIGELQSILLENTNPLVLFTQISKVSRSPKIEVIWFRIAFMVSFHLL